MKTTIKLGNVEFKGVKLENIELTQEYSLSEATGMISFGKKFLQDIVKEMPAMFENLEVAFNKFNEIDARVEVEEKARTMEIERNSHEAIERLVSDKQKELIQDMQLLIKVRGCTTMPLDLQPHTKTKLKMSIDNQRALINKAVEERAITGRTANRMLKEIALLSGGLLR